MQERLTREHSRGHCPEAASSHRGSILPSNRPIDPRPEAFDNFNKAGFAEVAVDEETKQLIAVAVTHVTQCPYWIRGHSKLAKRKGASAAQIMEAIRVAAEMRAGVYAHSTFVMDAIGEIPTRSGHDVESCALTA